MLSHGVRRKTPGGRQQKPADGAARPAWNSRTPRSSASPRQRTPRTNSSTPMDKVQMLVMEANEISQYLQKDYVFTKDASDAPECADNLHLTKIHVSNKKLGVCCVWSVNKLKERLVKMRKLMYANEEESSALGSASAFFDATDNWIKIKDEETSVDTRSGHLPQEDIRPVKSPSLTVVSARKTTCNGTGTAITRNTKSASSPELMKSPQGDSNDDSGLPEKYLTSSDLRSPQLRLDLTDVISSPSRETDRHSAVGATPRSEVGRGTPRADGLRNTPMITFCRDIVSVIAGRTHEAEKRESLVDKVLYSCESVKTAVINVLESYTQAQEQQTVFQFVDSELVKVSSMQLVASLETLVSCTALWATSLEQFDSPVVAHLSSAILASVRELGKHLVTFLKGCEQSDECSAHNAAPLVLDVLFALVQQCGQLVLAADVPLTQPLCCLADTPRESLQLLVLNRDTRIDPLRVHPSVDLKQALLSGCDIFANKTLEAGVSSVEENENTLKDLLTQCQTSCQNSEGIVKHVFIVVTKCKMLIIVCQKTQMKLDASMKDDRKKPRQFFENYFKRCEALLCHANTLVDNVTLLTHATQPLSQDKDVGTLRKVSRCASLVRSVADKLTTLSSQTCNSKTATTTTTPRTPRTPRDRVQADWQAAGDGVNTATTALIDLIDKHLTLRLASQNQRTKRMLPQIPSGRSITRCKSATDRRRLDKHLALQHLTHSEHV